MVRSSGSSSSSHSRPFAGITAAAASSSTTKTTTAAAIAVVFLLLCFFALSTSSRDGNSIGKTANHRMFTASKTILRTEKPEVVQYRILDSNNNSVTFRRMLDALVDPGSSMAEFMTETLTNHFGGKPGAYFFECIPVSRKTLDEAVFEFVLIPASALDGVAADHSPFDEHLSDPTTASAHVISFLNLGRDAMLIVPRPLSSESHYTHLSEFIRTAPRHQTNLLWQRVAEGARKQLDAHTDDEKKLWISTSGMGVYWLHIRLDSVPKYYNWVPYKKG